MKITIQLLAFIILMSCGQNESTTSFYEKCSNSQLNLNNGIVITDSLGYFSYRIPDSTWNPKRLLTDNENGLVVGDSSQGYIRGFNVNQSDYGYEWNWEEEQEIVKKNFNVLESGVIYLSGQESRYNLILFEKDTPQIISFFVTVIDSNNKKQYTLNLATEYANDYKSRICKLKPLLESFKIKN